METLNLVTHQNGEMAAEQVSQPKPFEIRGHHLNQFAFLVRDGLTPKKKAQLNAAAALFNGRSYAADTVGTTEEQLSEYQAKLTTVYKRFMELPSDYPVHIVSARKDEFCKACTIGAHCSLSKNGNVVWSEEKHMDYFQTVAERIGEGENVTSEREILHFTDAKPGVSSKLVTTANTVRKVLEVYKQSQVFDKD